MILSSNNSLSRFETSNYAERREGLDVRSS
jgi:hypothetical protein